MIFLNIGLFFYHGGKAVNRCKRRRGDAQRTRRRSRRHSWPMECIARVLRLPADSAETPLRPDARCSAAADDGGRALGRLGRREHRVNPGSTHRPPTAVQFRRDRRGREELRMRARHSVATQCRAITMACVGCPLRWDAPGHHTGRSGSDMDVCPSESHSFTTQLDFPTMIKKQAYIDRGCEADIWNSSTATSK